MLTREKKEAQVQTLAGILKESPAIVFTDFSGLSTPELNELRGTLREGGIRYKATKKSLWPFVRAQVEGQPEEILFPEHEGSVAIAYSDGEGIETSKILTKFAKDHEQFAILGALVQGEFLNVGRIKELASLPSREELLAKVAYLLASPMRGLVGVLNGPQREFVQVLQQVAGKKQ